MVSDFPYTQGRVLVYGPTKDGKGMLVSIGKSDPRKLSATELKNASQLFNILAEEMERVNDV